jgi:myo-inositol catabolism protein IolC
MRTPGFDGPLYILPFDHRHSFQTKLFGWTGVLNPEQTAQIADTKQLIYDAFRLAIGSGVPKSMAAILADEQFGRNILVDARTRGYTTACAAEKSGQAEFDFEYGEEFAKHIEDLQPTFSKVLIRYNPRGDGALNQRQAGRLRRLSEYLRVQGKSFFMIELLVPVEKSQLEQFKGDQDAYDQLLRPQLMVESIEQLQEKGVEPDVWKVEGLDSRKDCQEVVSIARRGGRDKVGCIVLGRGENERRVRAWLTTAAAVPGFIGFAVGRTSFWNPIVRWRASEITRQETVYAISRRYCEFVEMFDGHACAD